MQLAWSTETRRTAPNSQGPDGPEATAGHRANDPLSVLSSSHFHIRPLEKLFVAAYFVDCVRR